ncbi:MAG: BCCT family transporter [Bacilli bacterium]
MRSKLLNKKRKKTRLFNKQKHGKQRFYYDKKDDKNYVLIFSLILTAVVVSIGIFYPKKFNDITTSIFSLLIDKFSPLYLMLMLTVFIFSIYLAFSKYGNLKLGQENDEPEFSNIVWFSMLFGAGMGIGLVFFGAWEPLCHFINPLGLEPGSEGAIRFAIQQSFIHWGFIPWSSYAIIGLALGYFQYRKGKIGLISSTLDPILQNVKGKNVIKLIVDVLAVFITVIGVAASLGLGTMEIGGGLEYIFGINNTQTLQIFIIVIICVIYIATAVSGLNKGMKLLSNINLTLALILVIGCFFIGPTAEIINTFINGLGDYVNYFVSQSLFINPVSDNEWVYKWRIFYWAYSISWTPFVGVFIARISKGRTIKEFVLGVIVVPSLICMLWFTIFGMMGMELGLDFARDAILVTETTLFKLLSNYHFGLFFSLIAIVLLFTFFITSANSAIYVLGMFTSRGDLNPKNIIKVVWGVTQGLFAVVFIMLGGLQILQRFAIVVSFPFSIIIVGIMVSLMKQLKKDNG